MFYILADLDNTIPRPQSSLLTSEWSI
jgi:hypothetical protein